MAALVTQPGSRGLFHISSGSPPPNSHLLALGYLGYPPPAKENAKLLHLNTLCDTGSPFFLASALSCAMDLMLEGLALELRVASGGSCL